MSRPNTSRTPPTPAARARPASARSSPARGALKLASAADAEPLVQLDRSFGYLFKQAHRAFTRALDRRLKPCGITLAQWYFLRELWVEEDVTQRELSRRMDVSEPTTAVAIDLMEKAGLVVRQRDPAQRNSVRVTLTAEGRRLKEALLPIAGDVNENAAKGLKAGTLNEVRTSIITMIDNLNAVLDAEPAPEAAASARKSTAARKAAAPSKRPRA